MNKKTIYNNLFSLSFYQSANFIFPLVITPILLKNVGIEKVGLITTAQALINVFILVCDYGFNIIGVKQLIDIKENKIELNKLYINIQLSKLILISFCFIIFLALINYINFLKKENLLYLFSFSLIIGRSLFPIWFFQGFQKMKYLIGFSILSKFVSFLLIYILIKKSLDYVYVNLIIGINEIIVCLIYLIYIQYRYKFKIKIANWKGILFQLKYSFNFFLNNFISAININFNVILLSHFSNLKDLGIYSICEKIVYLCRNVFSIIFQVVYPYLCEIWKKNRQLFLKEIKYIYLIILFLSTILSFLIYLNSDFIISFFTKDYNKEIIFGLRIFIFSIIISTINIPSYIIIILINKQKTFLKIIVFSNIIYFILSYYLVPKYSYLGTIAVVYFSDLIIVMSCFILIFYQRNNLSKLNNQSFLNKINFA